MLLPQIQAWSVSSPIQTKRFDERSCVAKDSLAHAALRPPLLSSGSHRSLPPNHWLGLTQAHPLKVSVRDSEAMPLRLSKRFFIRRTDLIKGWLNI